MKVRFIINLLLPLILLLLNSGKYVSTNYEALPSKSEKSLEVGEELVYVVKYSVMRLGEVKLRITDKKDS